MGALDYGISAHGMRFMGRSRMNFWRIAALLGIILGAVGADMRETSAQKDTRTGTEMLPSCRAFLEGPEALKNATQEENLRAGARGLSGLFLLGSPLTSGPFRAEDRLAADGARVPEPAEYA